MLPDAELAVMVAKPSDPQAALNDVIGLAVRRGGPDNASGVLIFVDQA
jgi:hypothetical protein